MADIDDGLLEAGTAAVVQAMVSSPQLQRCLAVKGKYVVVRPELAQDYPSFDIKGCYIVYGCVYLRHCAQYVYHVIAKGNLLSVNAGHFYMILDAAEIKRRKLHLRPKRRLDLDG